MAEAEAAIAGSSGSCCWPSATLPAWLGLESLTVNFEERLCPCILSHTKVVAAVTSAGKSDLSFLSSSSTNTRHSCPSASLGQLPFSHWTQAIESASFSHVNQGKRASETLVLLLLQALSNEVFTKLKK